MNIEETLQYIHSKERFGIKPGLERIEKLLELLGNPQDSLDVVHVAGTNGKGSTCKMLACGLAETGYKVGLYTSPYVICFNERIQINGEMISDDDLASLATEIRPIEENSGIEITEFELVTAMAFLYFAAKGVDILICEVGLGGRFDATNVIKKPLASVITPVSLDHTDILGDTVEKIAAEKCGIIKENCPVVSSDMQEIAVLDVIDEYCTRLNAPLNIPDAHRVNVISESINGTEFEFFGRKVFCPFTGKHQLSNCLTALTTAFTLRNVHEVSFNNTLFIEGIKKASMPARQEIICEEPLILLDGSHNPDGLNALKNTVEKYIPRENSTLIIGMLKDKDVENSISQIAPLFENIIAVEPSNPRKMAAEDLCEIIKKYNASVKVMTAEDAIKNITSTTVIAGSLYLAGDLRGKLKGMYAK